MNKEEEGKINQEEEKKEHDEVEVLDKKIQEELDKIIPKIKEKILKNDNTSEYSGIIRGSIIENKDLLLYFSKIGIRELEKFLTEQLEITENTKKVAEAIKKWYRTYKLKTNAQLKKLKGVLLSDEEIQLLKVKKRGRPKNNKDVPKKDNESEKNNENEKNKSKSDNTKENSENEKNNLKESKFEIKNITGTEGKCVTLNEDAKELIENLKEKLKERNSEFSKLEVSLESFKSENLMLKKALESKGVGIDENVDYTTFLDIKSALKLQEDVGKDMISLELENYLIIAVANFVKQYNLLEVTNFTSGNISPQSKLVKAALIAMLKRNKFL